MHMTIYTYMPEGKIVTATGERTELLQQMTKGKKTHLNLTSKSQSRCLHWQCLSQRCVKPSQGNPTPFRPLHTKSILNSPKEFLNTARYQQNTGNQDSSQILLQDLFNWLKRRLGYHWVHLKAKEVYTFSQMHSGHNCLMEEDNAVIESTSNYYGQLRILAQSKHQCLTSAFKNSTWTPLYPKKVSAKAYSLSYLSLLNSVKCSKTSNQLEKNPRDINKLLKHGKSHDPTSPH